MKFLQLIFWGVLLSLHLSFPARAQGHFELITDDVVATIMLDNKESSVVKIARDILVSDIRKVSQRTIVSRTDASTNSIVAGTIGQSKYIDQLIKSGKLEVSAIQGQWESYSIQLIENAFDNCKKALVVVGADRRATAYGLLELSRMMGVSPWEWWADVTPDVKSELILDIENKVYASPSVKYRGLFLNDEDWGLQRWAALNFEPETGDIGPKTYAKVFELLLRLRANTIWPAMHSCTKPFYSYPENKKVADDYAIVVGTSHCEPMLCNINAEWDSKTMGEWRYDSNSETIKELFQQRAEESAKYDGIYTMGMRGEHDSPMIVGEDDTDSQVDLLQQVVLEQREILEQRLGKKATDVPQIFIPYKEVLTYYQAGMELPEDITLMWTDDNYGYIRQLSTPEEQKRSGGAGVYYHTSYWGRPHDYLWLNSTNPVLMWEEMSKAYELGAKDIWVLNCGDIKPHEYTIELFLDMAWDMSAFDESADVQQHMYQWAGREFAKEQAQEITDVMYENYRLSFQRRPEFMAWSQVEPVTKARETAMTQIHYGDEVSSRISAWQKIVDKVEELKSEIQDNRQDAFYQLVYYPVVGAANLNQKWLYAYKNKQVATQGRRSALDYAEASGKAYEKIVAITDYYNHEMQGGKWNSIMSLSPRHLPVFSKPITAGVNKQEMATLGLALESYEMAVNHDVINSFADVLPVFNAYINSHYFIDVFLKGQGQGQVNWEAHPRSDWIILTSTKGQLTSLDNEQRLWVSIDWDKVPQGEQKKEAALGHDYQLIPPSYKVNSAIDFVSGDSTITIGVSVFNPKLKELEGFGGFVEDKGFVAMNAEHFSRKKDGAQAKWETIEGLGYSGEVVTPLPRSSKTITDTQEILKNSPVLEYDFYAFNFGHVEVVLQAVPTHAFHKGRGVRCAIAIDDAEPTIVDFQTHGRSEAWKHNVLCNATKQMTSQIVNKAGFHQLKVWMVDPGLMIDQIMIDFGGWKPSYSFPQESKK